jgi:hypothetical protein
MALCTDPCEHAVRSSAIKSQTLQGEANTQTISPQTESSGITHIILMHQSNTYATVEPRNEPINDSLTFTLLAQEVTLRESCLGPSAPQAHLVQASKVSALHQAILSMSFSTHVCTSPSQPAPHVCGSCQPSSSCSRHGALHAGCKSLGVNAGCVMAPVLP